YSEPFHPVTFGRQRIAIRDLPAGEVELGSIQIQTRRQDRHSAPTLGLRFGDELAWITDTAFDPGSVELAAGCRLLAHEAWFPSAEPRNPDIHTSARHAAEIAGEAGAEQLLLIHLPPFEVSVEALAVEAQLTFPRSLIAGDEADLSTILA